MSRPRIFLHHKWAFSSRNPQGYTANNPPVINVGIDNPEMYWSLSWNYILEIRNNSSFTAYNIGIDYINLPPKTFIEGEFGKIEPFQSHEKREFTVKIIQNVTGTFIDADNYLENNPTILTQKFKIRINYLDEYGSSFGTVYNWQKNKNLVTLAKSSWMYLSGILITLCIIILMTIKALQASSTSSRPTQPDPVIDIQINPMSYNYDSNTDYSEATLPFTVQTSHGPYQILDDIKIDTFIVLQQDYFLKSYPNDYPTSEIVEVVLDHRILDDRVPEESGLLKLRNRFVLKGDKFLDLYLSKKKELIAKLIVAFPYKYEGKVLFTKKEVPFTVFVK